MDDLREFFSVLGFGNWVDPPPMLGKIPKNEDCNAMVDNLTHCGLGKEARPVRLNFDTSSLESVQCSAVGTSYKYNIQIYK